jgi:hypothetical protein
VRFYQQFLLLPAAAFAILHTDSSALMFQVLFYYIPPTRNIFTWNYHEVVTNFCHWQYFSYSETILQCGLCFWFTAPIKNLCSTDFYTQQAADSRQIGVQCYQQRLTNSSEIPTISAGSLAER